VLGECVHVRVCAQGMPALRFPLHSFQDHTSSVGCVRFCAQADDGASTIISMLEARAKTLAAQKAQLLQKVLAGHTRSTYGLGHGCEP